VVNSALLQAKHGGFSMFLRGYCAIKKKHLFICGHFDTFREMVRVGFKLNLVRGEGFDTQRRQD
jgi:hypothetical protein